MRGVPHPDETRAAVLAALLAGQSVSEVARQFKLNRSQVLQWRTAYGADSGLLQQQKGEEIGDLVATFLRETLTTVSFLAVSFRNPEWLAKQSAADSAVLFGVVSDKGFRLLEAVQQANLEPADEPSP